MKKSIIQIALILYVFTGYSQTRVTDINPNGDSHPVHLRAINGQLFFNAVTPSLGTEPYVMDTAGNVTLIADIRAGGGSGAEAFTEFNGNVFFLASPNSGNTELYRYSSGSLTKINTIGTKNSYRTNLTVYENSLVFALHDGTFNFGEELYQCVGNNNSVELVKNINSGLISSNPRDFIEMNGKLYFTAVTDAYGLELWSYNGNVAVRETDMVTGSPDGLANTNGLISERFIVFQDELYFAAKSSSQSGLGLYKYDGSAPPQLVTVGQTDFKQISNFYEVNNKLVFTALDAGFVGRTYEYDGANSVSIVSDTLIQLSIKFQNKLIFVLADSAHGSELWEYDGIGKPQLVADINPGTNSSVSWLLFYNFKRYAIFDNKLFFTADNGTEGMELWEYDGMSSPTMVMDINSGPDSGLPSYLEVLNNNLYFSATDGINGTEIWKLKGSPLSIAEHSTSNKLKIYPNPAVNTVFLEGNIVIERVVITDVLGRTLMIKENPNKVIDVSQLSNGTYFLTVISTGERFTKTIVIEE